MTTTVISMRTGARLFTTVAAEEVCRLLDKAARRGDQTIQIDNRRVQVADVLDVAVPERSAA